MSSITSPMVRVRIAHGNTAKGWRLSETTVEWHGPVSDMDEVVPALRCAMQEAYDLGNKEAEDRREAEKA